MIFQHGGKLVRLVVPKGLKNARVETVRPLVENTRLNVTVTSDGPSDTIVSS